MSEPRDPSATSDQPTWAPLSGPTPSPYTPAQSGPPESSASPYAAPPPGSYAPADAAGWDPSAQQGWGGPQHWGPPGHVRGTGRCILLAIVTIGIYTYVYNYKVHSEMKAHSGRGLGGGVALLITFVAGVAMPFVTSAEVGGLYSRRGEKEPVNGWTGLWLVAPAVIGYVLMFISLIALSETLESGDGSGLLLGAVVVAFLAAAVAGAVVWFVKTNGALNRYWASLGAA